MARSKWSRHRTAKEICMEVLPIEELLENVDG